MGAEYAWGTLRTTLTGGPSRRQLLSSKLVLLVLAAAAGLLVVSVIAVVASLVAAVIPPSEEGGFVSIGKWSDAGITFVKAVYALAPYIALGTFLAVVMQSSSISISISLGYYVVEQIVTPLLKLNDSLAKITDYILGGSVGNWMDSVFVTVEVPGEGAGNRPAGCPTSVLGNTGLHRRARRCVVLDIPTQGRRRGKGRLNIRVSRSSPSMPIEPTGTFRPE